MRDDDALLIIFTSGTQGCSRAILTHANCFWTNLALSRTAEITKLHTVLAVMPQYHVGGWNVQPLLAWWVGATVVLERTFSIPGRVLQLIQDRRITTTMGVPANYLFLSEHPSFANADLSSLRHAIVGGAPMPEPLLRTWHSRGSHSPRVTGSPRQARMCCAGPTKTPAPKWGSPVNRTRTSKSRLPTPSQAKNSRAKPRELLVRGPSVFPGSASELTAAALRDGWLHTGDSGAQGC